MLSMMINVYILLLYIVGVMCATRINNKLKPACKEMPDSVLEEILGSAFNPRYMSIDVPSIEMPQAKKRKIDLGVEFYVDSEYQDDSSDQPAWSVTNHVEATRNMFGNSRYKRDMEYLQEWKCKSRIKWTDLGPDYFPRYLRSVECLAENCWFNIYKCRPRSFTVKILKKRRDRCVWVDQSTSNRIGVSGLPRELKELWVWEERAVTFCCDCSL